MICGACGRPCAGGACIDCPRVALDAIRAGVEGAALWRAAPDLLHLESPLAWPELTPRGRRALRLAVLLEGRPDRAWRLQGRLNIS